MILAGVVGWSLQQFADVAHAIVPALLIGMVVALFVPAKGACAVPARPVEPQGPNGR